MPYPFETHYTEGSAQQWLWFVPHDPGGLVSLFPSNRSFTDKLHTWLLNARPTSMGGKWPYGTVLAKYETTRSRQPNSAFHPRALGGGRALADTVTVTLCCRDRSRAARVPSAPTFISLPKPTP